MARRKKKRNASRGSVNNIILKTLANGDKYGYEIIKEVEEYSNGKIQLKQPSLYSSLSRFEEKKFVSSYWGDSDIGGRRHYYHLTDEGLAYYKKFVLKEDEVKDVLDSNNIILSSSKDSDTQDEDIYDEELDDELEDDLSSDEEEINSDNTILNDVTPTISPISQDEIPAFADFEVKDSNEEINNIIETEHVFHNPTPIENMIIDKSPSITNTDIDSDNSNARPWQVLADSTKKSNKSFSEHNYNKLFIKKPKKEQKIVKDVDGIFKLRDEDYIPKKPTYNPVIIDNVISRTKSTNLYGYSNPEEIKNSKKENFVEISEEERLKRNEYFLAKFNLLTKSKMKPVSAPAPKPIEDKPEKQIDYRGKLNAVFDSSNYEDESIELNTTQPENNLFNFKDNDEWQTDFDNNDSIEDDDKYIEFDTVEKFEVKQDNKQYIEEISNYSTPASQVNMTRYEHTTQAVLVDKIYLLNNKLKMVFGIIMSLLMIAEITVSWILFKNFDLVKSSNDKVILILSYVVIGIFALFTILPFVFNSNSHKANNFKFKYSFWFGILTFLVTSILIYCINALTGFKLNNIDFFAVKLFLPIILMFNFVISPIVYSILIKKKCFYD